MSCYRPLSIANPKLVKNTVFDKMTLSVPCGHCEACKDTRRLGWFVRLYYEWQYCINQGGFALYETLTYNNDSIPRLFETFEFDNICLNHNHYSNGLKGLPCFSRRDVQLYLKRIRKHVNKVYPYVDIKGKIKYFLSMEMGSKTYRPHYHVIFFVSSALIRPYDFKHIVESLWHEKGFTKQGSLNDGFVCNQGGINYCAKYVCKDLFEDEYWLRVCNRMEKMGLKKEDYLDCLPRNMQSTNLGVYALELDEYNDFSNFLEGYVNIPDKKLEIKKYKLPLYYERKLFYNVLYRYFDAALNEYVSVQSISDVPKGLDYSPVYVLNDLGLEMKDKRFQNVVDSVVNTYRIVQSIPNIPHVLDKLNNKYEKKFSDIKEFQNFIKQNLSEEEFVSYSLVFRGCNYKIPTHTPCLLDNRLYRCYSIINNVSAGVKPLSVDVNYFNYECQKVQSIPFIEDYFQMIRYVYFLIHLELEEIFKQKEFEYIEQKTIFLLSKEEYVYV